MLFEINPPWFTDSNTLSLSMHIVLQKCYSLKAGWRQKTYRHEASLKSKASSVSV